MLQHDAEPAAGAAPGRDQALGRVATVSSSGFSTSTCLPAAKQRSATSRWAPGGVRTSTAVTAGSVMAASMSVVTRERKVASEGGGAGLAAARRPAHLDPVGEVEQALRMRDDGGPEPDDGDADPVHRRLPHAAGRAGPAPGEPACASSASRLTVKTCSCGMAVSVRSLTSAMKARK